jgi:hypothetical protein
MHTALINPLGQSKQGQTKHAWTRHAGSTEQPARPPPTHLQSPVCRMRLTTPCPVGTSNSSIMAPGQWLASSAVTLTPSMTVGWLSCSWRTVGARKFHSAASSLALQAWREQQAAWQCERTGTQAGADTGRIPLRQCTVLRMMHKAA